MTDRTDNFNRADTTNNIGTPSDAGSAWVQESGTWGITGNTAYQSDAAGAIYAACSLESSVSAVEVQVTVSTVDKAGPGGRIAGANDFIFVIVESSQLRLFKNVANSLTQLGSTFTGTVNNGDIIKLRMDSSNNLTVYQNGVSRITATDSAGSTNTKHGLIINSAASRFDDFSITAIAAGGGVFGSYFYQQVAGLGGNF